MARKGDTVDRPLYVTQVDDTGATNTESNPVWVRRSVNRPSIPGLTFSQTLSSSGSHTTSWVDVSSTHWLDIATKLESTAALTAYIEFTDASDPNTTPPGADDVVRRIPTTGGITLAGSSLGGFNDPSFGLPAQLNWARITVTDTTGGQDVDVTTYDHDAPPTGAQVPFATDLTKDFRAPLSQAVIRGEQLDDDLASTGTYTTAPLTSSRRLVTASPWITIAEGTSEDDGALPSGSTPAFDAVGPIVASNVIDTGWINATEYSDQFFHFFSDATGVKVFLMDASDDQGNNSVTTDFSTPSATSTANASINIGAPFFQDYFRVVIINDSGSTATAWSYRSQAGDDSPGPVYQSLDQPVLGFFPAPLTQSVTKGQQPDGDYVASKQDGKAFETTTPLTAAETYTSTWFDTDGWRSIEVYIATDQVSATQGIEVQYTEDTGAGTPNVRTGPKFTFSGDEVSTGFTILRVPTALDGFRLVYQNGGTAQGSFFLCATLHVDNVELPQSSLQTQLDDTSPAVHTRGAIIAPDQATGTWAGIESRDGGLGVSMEAHAVDTPIESLNSWNGNATSVGTTPTQIASSLPSGTRTVVIQAGNSNTKVVYLGPNSGLTVGNAPISLAAGQAAIFEVDNTPSFYARSASGSQTVRWFYVERV